MAKLNLVNALGYVWLTKVLDCRFVSHLSQAYNITIIILRLQDGYEPGCPIAILRAIDQCMPPRIPNQVAPEKRDKI